jgi:hypothetical protein
MRDFKRVLVCSDLHCGHRTGLTHPNWHRPNSEDKLDWIQSELWWRWKKEIEKLKPIDIAFWNGDLIEGRNKPSGELMTGDRNEQVIYAAHAMAETEAQVHVVSTGTTFHVGVEDFERNLRENALLAGKVKQAGAHNYVDVNGLVFDLKHKVGASSVPRYGKFTPIAKDALWARLWADKGWPESKVIIRSHTHEFAFCGDTSFLGMTTPGLQATSVYGRKEVSRTIDWGFVYFDVVNGEEFEWNPVILKLNLVKSKVLKL